MYYELVQQKSEYVHVDKVFNMPMIACLSSNQSIIYLNFALYFIFSEYILVHTLLASAYAFFCFLRMSRTQIARP